MVNVNIEGYGKFQVETSRISELIGWLSNQGAVQIKENHTKVHEIVNNEYTGRVLLDGRSG